MRSKFFVPALLSLSFIFNLLCTRQSQAKPSPVFEPIITEIKARLSSGLEMRLPAFIPTTDRDVTLYSFLRDDDSKAVIDLDDLKMEFFTVLIGNTPECSEQKNPRDCVVAAVGVTEDPIESPDQLDALLADNQEDITVVKFSQRIEGFYFVADELQLIIWRQNKMAHLVMSKECDRNCISKQQLINMAKSASQEPAITSGDTSFYSY